MTHGSQRQPSLLPRNLQSPDVSGADLRSRRSVLEKLETGTTMRTYLEVHTVVTRSRSNANHSVVRKTLS